MSQNSPTPRTNYQGQTLETLEQTFGNNHNFKHGTVSNLNINHQQDVLIQPNSKLVSLIHLKTFNQLTILRLPNNFLTSILDIQHCPNLIWLDVNNNQIKALPPARLFWKNMNNLMILNLHDNFFQDFADVQSVSGIKNLIALTLYNTPLSLKACQNQKSKNKPKIPDIREKIWKHSENQSSNTFGQNQVNNLSNLGNHPETLLNRPETLLTDPVVTSYRHQLVNSCRNLKAFDHHVVSDEEIIEHFKIPDSVPKYKTKSKQLRINLCPDHDSSVYDGDDAMSSYANVQDILAQIDKIIKHGSPVQIIQRYTRGWITRKILRAVLYKEEANGKDKRIVTTRQGVQAVEGSEVNNQMNPAPSEYSNELEIEPNLPNLIEKPLPFKFSGARPPTSSRITSARNVKPSTRSLLKTCEKLDNEEIPYYETNVLKKQPQKKYHSFYLKSEEETRNWIKKENENDIEFDEFGGIQKFRLKNQKINENTTKSAESGKITGRHISAQEFDSHAEKLESIHMAKVHRAQLEDLNSYKNAEEERYIEHRSKICKNQKSQEIQLNKQKSQRSEQTNAMLESIKPLIALSKIQAKQKKIHQIQSAQHHVQFTKELEADAIESKLEYKKVRQKISKENEKLEQELISLAISDNKRREQMHRELAARRAQVWRLKAEDTKETMEAGRRFAAEIATLNRAIVQQDRSFRKEQELQRKQIFVDDLRSKRGKSHMFNGENSEAKKMAAMQLEFDQIQGEYKQNTEADYVNDYN